MCKSMKKIKQITNSNLNHQTTSSESELVSTLIDNVIETKKTVLKSGKTETPQSTSLDILFLIDEFKSRFEKLGEKAREIAQKNGRTVVTYEDADEALKQIRTEKS
ncbi:hypothetical protein [Methanobacterium veterum]|uniref:Uncharacterized protein n=2 Tax=Methanobacterium veterum TaxID=408577 RepID=A0A9E5A229_9EURY|nr:hypothetical protein [Methanobacterium veterum]MCZ3371186.1 hypothetical protein [Methanobacterium veterum]